MGYKTFASMNIAVVGTGKYCEALSAGLAKAGHNVFMATRSEYDEVSKELLARYRRICPSSIEYAGAVADVIILATPAEEVREMAYFLEDVRQKVIIDLTGLNLTRYSTYINTHAAIKAITGSQHVVKCYNRTGSENLVATESTADMIIAGDSKKAKALTALLAKDLKFNACHDFGGDELIPSLDQMANNWQNLSISAKVPGSIAYRLIKR
ncbi:MAG: hypothetical protein EOP56_13775 [Sphingobacteriales bacterium]|nr:MAG: hypothetical protein EOP56_13775 [Sphingobacteriales bacterium]